jgi:hypothetical protein
MYGGLPTVEIKGATLGRRRILKKGRIFSADLQPILYVHNKDMFCRALINYSCEVNYLVYGGDQPTFYKGFFRPKNLQDQPKHTYSGTKIAKLPTYKLSMHYRYQLHSLSHSKLFFYLVRYRYTFRKNIFYLKLPPYTQVGFYITTHSSNLLGGRRF